jgi:hypothetical protein
LKRSVNRSPRLKGFLENKQPSTCFMHGPEATMPESNNGQCNGKKRLRSRQNSNGGKGKSATGYNANLEKKKEKDVEMESRGLRRIMANRLHGARPHARQLCEAMMTTMFWMVNQLYPS